MNTKRVVKNSRLNKINFVIVTENITCIKEKYTWDVTFIFTISSV